MKHIISSIQSRLPSSRFVISGDFNERRSEVDKLLFGKGLSQVLPEGKCTDLKGGHLYQIYSNLQILEYDTLQLPFTNHKIINVKFRFSRNEEDIDIRKMPRKITQGEMKK